MVYSAQFDKGLGGYVLAGGSGVNEAKIWERGIKNGKLKGAHQCEIGTIKGLAKPCLTVDMGNSSTLFCIGCADGMIRIFDLVEGETATESEMSIE